MLGLLSNHDKNQGILKKNVGLCVKITHLYI
jgi:hypothetical protein